jgi:hypothetical protein
MCSGAGAWTMTALVPADQAGRELIRRVPGVLLRSKPTAAGTVKRRARSRLSVMTVTTAWRVRR